VLAGFRGRAPTVVLHGSSYSMMQGLSLERRRTCSGASEARDTTRAMGAARASHASAGVALCLVAWFALSSRAHGQVTADPGATWLTVRSDHFVIHYHEPLGVVARRVAYVAERAHAVLSPVLRHLPDEPTYIVLRDDSESANGEGTALPYNRMTLFVTGPADLSEFEDYDDWMGQLVTHEYAHVLHLDTVSGVPEIINALMGKFYSSNARLPRWFVEGLAVHQESRHTSGGRLRASQFDMFLRMAALEDRLLTLAQISNLIYEFPGGNAPYLYGARFLRYLADRYGDDLLADMIEDFGDDLVPFALNRVCRRHTGRTLVELYDEWQAVIVREYRAVAASIRARGIVEGTRLTDHGENTSYPTFVSDREVVYAASTRDEPFQLRRLDVRDGRSARVVRIRGRSASSLHPDGRRLYYATPAPHRDRYVFFDLFVHDLVDDDSERLSHGLRAEHPDIAPDGRRVAFTINGAGTRHLAIASLDDVEGSRRVLVRSRRFDQVYTPRWSPDGRAIAFSAWRRGGYRDIYLVDPETGTETRITSDRALDTGPAWSPDGRWLYFSSDRTGISNIYAYELASGTTMQVTNVLGGAFQPAISPDGSTLVYAGFTSRGFDLWTLPLDAARFRAADPYVDDRPEPANDDAEILPLVSENYDPLERFLPRSYGLSLGDDGTQARLVVQTAGGDAVRYAEYTGHGSTSASRAETSTSGSTSIGTARRSRCAFRSSARRSGSAVSTSPAKSGSGMRSSWEGRSVSPIRCPRCSMRRRSR
jgi:Tol biopolymer transport system component